MTIANNIGTYTSHTNVTYSSFFPSWQCTSHGKETREDISWLLLSTLRTCKQSQLLSTVENDRVQQILSCCYQCNTLDSHVAGLHTGCYGRWGLGEGGTGELSGVLLVVCQMLTELTQRETFAWKHWTSWSLQQLGWTLLQKYVPNAGARSHDILCFHT